MSLPTELPDLLRAARQFGQTAMVPSQPFELDLAEGFVQLNPPTGEKHSIQVAGTYAGDGMFVWGWSHPSVPDAQRIAAQELQTYARAHQMDALADRKMPATPLKARDYAAAVALVSGADAIFEGDYGDGLVYLCWSKED